MKLRDKIEKAFTFKSDLTELENVYVKTKTIDANKGATFNERVESLREFKEERLEQLTLWNTKSDYGL